MRLSFHFVICLLKLRTYETLTSVAQKLIIPPIATVSSTIGQSAGLMIMTSLAARRAGQTKLRVPEALSIGIEGTENGWGLSPLWRIVSGSIDCITPLAAAGNHFSRSECVERS
jgi:hypothetical protein